jgi:hypothetical protein
MPLRLPVLLPLWREVEDMRVPSIRRTTSDSAYTTETLEEAPIVCQHVWERHAEGTGCDTEDCGELRSGLVMQCAICRVERCRRYVSIRN